MYKLLWAWQLIELQQAAAWCILGRALLSTVMISLLPLQPFNCSIHCELRVIGCFCCCAVQQILFVS